MLRLGLLAINLAVVAGAATFTIADGNVSEQIAAINAANANPDADTINLASGGTYTFTAPYDNVDFAALPRITSTITIKGNGATIQRSSAAGTPDFSLFATLYANLRLDSVTVRGGSLGFGAGLNNNRSTLQITNSTVTGNNTGSSGDGGGIFNVCGALTIVNSTVSFNRSYGGYGGGGILNFTDSSGCSTTTTIVFSTIFENRADGPSGFQGRGDANADAFSAPGSIVVKNSILASPTQGLGGACYAVVPTSLGHNIADDTSCSLTGPGDMNNTNPLLGPTANNGGPTPIEPPAMNSPAIDAVPLSYCSDVFGVSVI